MADPHKVVLLTGATFAYRHLLMNFICSAKRVGVEAVLVAAFDEEMYRFGFEQVGQTGPPGEKKQK